MPDSADLKLEIASCWKVSWNVDPLPLSVPLRAALLDEEALLDEVALLPDDALLDDDEEHAARASAIATTAIPAVVTCCPRRSCISGTPYGF
jgi:hypothetical protein